MYFINNIHIFFFQISDYPDLLLQCTKQDQIILSIFYVDTGPYKRPKCGYRKRTQPVKLVIKLPIVEERLNVLVKNAFTFYYIFSKISQFFVLYFFSHKFQ